MLEIVPYLWSTKIHMVFYCFVLCYFLDVLVYVNEVENDKKNPCIGFEFLYSINMANF